MSTTCFTEVPLTYGVLYGCATEVDLEIISSWLERSGKSFSHPLMLPMIFMELERKRLLDAAAGQATELNQRVLDMEVRSKKQGKEVHGKTEENEAVQTGDSETIKMLLSMHELKNALDGLSEQLSTMRMHLGKPSELTLARYQEAGDITDTCGINIDLRLKEMVSELQSKSRHYEGLLEAITLATQMVCTTSKR